MIPRGADFPPNSAPPAKRREPATMRHDRPALPAAPSRAAFPQTGGRRNSGRGHAVLQRCAGRTQDTAPHSLRVMTPGVFGPATARTATARRRFPCFPPPPRDEPHPRSTRLTARPMPRKNGNFSSSPKRCGGLAGSAGALGPFCGLLSISPQKKEPARSQVGSLRILSLAAAFSLS